MAVDDLEEGIKHLVDGTAEFLYPNVMELASEAIRGCIIAPQGRKLVVSDLANIEGRLVSWLAGEYWKLDAFGAYDRGEGHDLYRLAYAKAFAVSPESVTKEQRQVGKVMELMLGYEGGVGAFVTGAMAYNIDLDKMAEAAYPMLPKDIVAEAVDFYEWRKKTKGNTFYLSQDTFVACESLKRLWRIAHSATERLWDKVRDCATQALWHPGESFVYRGLKFRRDGQWLRIKLPSGRCLCYPGARADLEGKISYMGMNSYSRRWERISTYGGKLVENITQATARDILAHNMQRIEDGGYEIVLTVHDEVITEAPDVEEYNDAMLSNLLATPPEWAPDVPLAADGFTTYRYRYD
jgi:DNA polymerase